MFCLSYCVVQPELGSIAHIVERWSRTNCLCKVLLRDPFDVAPLSPGHEDVDGVCDVGVMVEFILVSMVVVVKMVLMLNVCWLGLL